MALAFTSLSAALAATTAGPTYTGNAGTPVAGDLLVCFVMCTGITTVGTLSGGGWTWNLLYSVIRGGTDIISVWYAYAATATATTVVYTTTAAATGCFIHTTRVTGGEGQRQLYVRQSAAGSGSVAPVAATFPTAVLTGNGVIAWGVNATSTANQWTAPTGLTEQSEVNFISPNNSLEIAYAVSGVTATTLTWTNSGPSAWAVYALELYVAGTGPVPVQGNGETGFFGISNPY